MKNWRLTMCGLLVLIAAAGFVRVVRLDTADTRADEIWLVESLQAGMDTWTMFLFNVKDFKAGRQMPIPRTATTAFVRALGLDVSLTSVRLPFAIMGILTIPALWLLGVHACDRKLGWLLAFLGVVNPYNIFFSRGGHVYAFLMCFTAWACASFAIAITTVSHGRTPGWKQMLSVCLFSIGACYSHMSAWPVTGLLWLLFFANYYVKNGRLPDLINCKLIWISFGVWLLALLPWALVFLYGVLTRTTSSFWASLPTTRLDEFKGLWRMPFVMMWGGGPVRGTVTVGLFLTGVLGGLMMKRWRRLTFVLLIGGIVLFSALALVMGSTGFFTIRYFSPMWLIFLLISAVGLYITVTLVSRWLLPGNPYGVSCALCGLCACMGILMFSPIKWIVTLPGTPVPYTRMNKWMDAHLPKGTPVLVDRWFEPDHEMRFHAPLNVRVTFTIPDEPMDVFLKYQWRETAKQFFRRFPDAAYLELTKHYFEFPEVGYWQWPREFFRRHVVFTNEQAFALRESLLAPMEDYYNCMTNRTVVELFYNLPADAVEMARETGQTIMFLYGQGWGYTKLWPQVQDFRDWRVLEKEASLDIYNLTDSPQDIRVGIVAAAISGNKQVQSSSGSAFRFEQQKLMSWQFDLKAVASGKCRLILRDPLWSVAKAPLLVGAVEVGVAQDGSQTESHSE